MADLTGSNIGFLSTAINRVEAETCTLGSMAVDTISPVNFAFAIVNRVTSTNGGSVIQYPIHLDLTDQNGNGILVATDRMFLYGGGVANTLPGTYTAKILYRLVEVGIQEYVGIVSAQQG